MFTVDVPKLLVSFFTFYTISSVLYDMNISVIRATADLLNQAFGGDVAEEEEEEEEEEEKEEEEEALCAKSQRRQIKFLF